MKGRKPDAHAIRRGVTDAYTIAAPEERHGLQMPDDIAEDPALAPIWAMVAPPANNFTQQDENLLRSLVQWSAVYTQACEAMTAKDGSGRKAILTMVGTVRGLDGQERPVTKRSPAIQVMKEASAEIRALSDMLGLSPLARSRIGLIQATTVKTAADTAAMFQGIAAAYGELEGGGIE